MNYVNSVNRQCSFILFSIFQSEEPVFISQQLGIEGEILFKVILLVMNLNRSLNKGGNSSGMSDQQAKGKWEKCVQPSRMLCLSSKECILVFVPLLMVCILIQNLLPAEEFRHQQKVDTLQEKFPTLERVPELALNRAVRTLIAFRYLEKEHARGKVVITIA